MRPQQLENFEVPLGSYVFKRDESGAKLQLDDGKSFSITLPESRILYKLMQTPNSVVDKQTLILEAWGSADIIGPNSLPVAITNLRKILKVQNIDIVNSPRKGYLIKVSSPESIPDENSFERKDVHESKDINNSDTPKPLSEVNQKTSQISRFNHLWPMYISAFLICLSLYATFYVWLSWIEDECGSFDGGTVCYIKGDHPPNSSEVKGKAGNFYYSSGSGWIKVEGNIYD